MNVDEVAWLIERWVGGPQWVAGFGTVTMTAHACATGPNPSAFGSTGVSVVWTADSLRALRFSRKVDAESVILSLGLPDCSATEHAWLAGIKR